MTTGEHSDLNQTDLTQWKGTAAALDTDGDGLPNWYEFIIGTDPNKWSRCGGQATFLDSAEKPPLLMRK